MDPRMMKRLLQQATIGPGARIAGAVGSELGQGAMSGMAKAGPAAAEDMLGAIPPAGSEPSALAALRAQATAGKGTGRIIAGGVGGAFGALVRPDGAVKRTAGGVSGSLKRYTSK